MMATGTRPGFSARCQAPRGTVTQSRGLRRRARPLMRTRGLPALAYLLDDLRRHVVVEEEDHDGAAALGAAPHVHGGDVDAMPAQDGADLADHARPVLVGE